MKVGLVITTYNRPEYFKKCIESINASDIDDSVTVVIVDDCSSTNIFEGLNLNFKNKIFLSSKNQGVCYSLLRGFGWLIEEGCELLINLDSDALVRNDFFSSIKKLYKKFPEHLITGFHSINKNKDGSDRHPIIEMGDGWCKKKSVGGINFAISNDTYEYIVKGSLQECYEKGGNWDHLSCITAKHAGKDIICAVPSIVQHIGFDSSMGHDEEPDVASDFKPLHLPNVTLIGVDCVHPEKLLYAINQSCENILFGDVKLLSSKKVGSKYWQKIREIKSIEDYSSFMIRELSQFIDTDYALIVQHDGFVKNWKAWENNFLKYDYIGATWWYKDGMNVGNGGFSLRSKRLIDILAKDQTITKTHPEDHHICRTYRKYLEDKYAIKYAPEHVAKKFSIEGYRSSETQYNGQFGYHGGIVKFPTTTKKTVIINQPRGLGDIIFCAKIAQDFIKEGCNIVWPVVPEYVSIGKHFPGITFIDHRLVNINYEKKKEHDHFGCTVIPLRFSDSICKVKYSDCMKSKYMLFNKDWQQWRDLSIERDQESEKKLESLILSKNGLKKGDPYNIVNTKFRTDMTGSVNVSINNELPCIYMEPEPGYTMIDWSYLLEGAKEIHTVGTSINYLIELINVTADVHLYIRRPDENDFNNYNYILTEKVNYIFHE